MTIPDASVLAALRTALTDRYDVARELGAGGMATVYLAHDLKHDRDVAIKVLHPDLGAVLGGERFLSEIKTTARLQHPHILPLLDSGDAGGLLYYVMPFVAGETLRARLERETQLPVADALRIAREAGDALSEAHAKGIVHRDIKPENILLQGAHALVADFGIALAVQSAGGTRLTQTGLSLGTPQYMAPEQAMGDKSVDHRADQYALAVMTYEMLVGEPPFTGPNAQAIVAKLLTESVRPASSVRTAVPLHVDDALQTALAKLPADRFNSVADFLTALRDENATSAVRRSGSRAAAASSGTTFIRATIAAVALAAVAGVGGWWLASKSSSSISGNGEEERVIRLQVVPPDSVRAVLLDPSGGALNADGSELIWAGVANGGPSRLYRQRTDRLVATVLNSTLPSVAQPLFSPDGKWAAYTGADGRSLTKLRLDDGTSIRLCECALGNGIDWGSASVIVSGSTSQYRGLSTISIDGGAVTPLTAPADTLTEHVFPKFLGDSREIAFAEFRGSLRRATLALTSLDDKSVYPLGVEGIRPLGVLDQHLVYVRFDGTIMAVPFDQRSHKVTGAPVAVHDPVQVPVFQNGNSFVAMNARGDLVTFEARSLASIAAISTSGPLQDLGLGERELYGTQSVTSDGNHIALTLGNRAGSQLYSYSLRDKTMTKLSRSRWVSDARWSNDGRRLFYFSSDGDGLELREQIADGSSPGTRVATLAPGSSRLALSPDGRRALYAIEVSGDVDIQSTSLDTAAHATSATVISTPANESPHGFSPDGGLLLVSTTESGRAELSVHTMPTLERRLQISSDGHIGSAFWSADGLTVYYLNVQRDIVAVRLQRTPTPSIASRTVVRAADASTRRIVALLGVFADGRFLVSYDLQRKSRYVVELNWRREFRAKGESLGIA